jgi:hypothetical protein
MKKTAIYLLLACISTVAFAQENLSDLLEEDELEEEKYVSATFKGTRLINLHTIETVGKRTLDFRIAHRFGDFNTGAYNFFGLDGGASLRLGLEYSYNGRLMFGLGRSSIGKLYDGFIKYRLLRQTTDNKMPISATWVSSINLTAMRDPNSSITGYNKYSFFENRLSYFNQLIIGRKFNESFSLQISPTWIHYNLVEKVTDSNAMYAVAIAARVKLTKRMALTGEYVYRLNKYSDVFSSFYNSASIGIDVETGGHVFQMHFTNSLAMNEVQYIPYTSSNWLKGGIRLGFNISRVFSL